MSGAYFKPRGVLSLVPRCCAVCEKWPSHGLCCSCYALFKRQPARCTACGVEMVQTRILVCGLCLSSPYVFDEVVAAVSYEEPWRLLVHRLKFLRATEYAGVMAQLMQLVIGLKGVQMPDLVLPVASAPERLRGRGYNQAWEIARRLARLMCLPARGDVLRRVHHSESLAHLKRSERFRVLKGAFAVSDRYTDLVAHKHVVVVDDVMTTGATLQAAAQALKGAGAARVSGWVFARTPEQRDKR